MRIGYLAEKRNGEVVAHIPAHRARELAATVLDDELCWVRFRKKLIVMGFARTVSPQRHLNPRMQFRPVSIRRNPSKSFQRQRTTTIRFFDFKGLRAKLLN
jgi:hypothetical protein